MVTHDGFNKHNTVHYLDWRPIYIKKMSYALSRENVRLELLIPPPPPSPPCGGACRINEEYA